jgi:plastocyanin
MKSKLLLSILMLSISITGYCTTWTITAASGVFAFSPSTLTISAGDSVRFTVASMHVPMEVSQATWNANGNTQLAGGFSLPSGGGLVLPAQLGAGMHYYVCNPHASFGMKGTINVSPNGIAQITALATISVFPNPATDLITIKAAANTGVSTYSVSDLVGKQVAAGKLTNETTSVDISQLTRGVYFFQVIADEKRQSFKVVKE